MNFTEQQYLVIKALADGICPATGVIPPASALPVADMFASIAGSWAPAIFQATANALDVINDIALSIFGQPIQNLDQPGIATVTSIVANNTDLKPFWEPFRILIALNYYALPPVYSAIGLPGPTIDAGGLTTEGYPV
jgi:hypothetical protein